MDLKFPFSIIHLLLSVCIFLSLFLQPHSQQTYLNNTCLLSTIDPANISQGYLCDGHSLLSCKSFVAFRPRGPCANATSIAQLLGSESSEIASLNDVSSSAKIGADKLVVVPLSCACPVSYFQHFATYLIGTGETYYTIANMTYQGLTTCKALQSQNPNYDFWNISAGTTEVIVRVRCACPSDNQTASGVTSLLTYVVEEGDAITSIGKRFGVSEQSVLDANMLSRESVIVANTPVLVPLRNESCSMNPRMFFCGCSASAHVANLSSEGSHCIPVRDKSFSVKSVTLLGFGIGLALLCFFLSSYKVHQLLKKRRVRVMKERFFEQNGGILLHEKLSSDRSREKAKLFTAEELQRATDNYNESRFLGQGGFGRVYKGMLPDGRVVAIKKSKAIGKNEIEQFINEVVVLSDINHRNIVELLGCCLETETPLLIYEFISNGTLSHHIRRKDLELNESPLSWENRLSIACDVAGALSYMHSSASMPIYHRDIKSSNILLDDKYNAKISDFGTSRSVPQDKTHLTTAVQGTLGYMDPEYFQSGQFTDKSDVYSFGVTLVELLTGENPYSFAANQEGKNLVSTFISMTKENDQLCHILDPRVDGDVIMEDIRIIAELATRCLRSNGKKRPTMKQVSIELEGLRNRRPVSEMEQDTRDYFRDDESYLITTIDDTSRQESGESSTNS
ncbi:hypothetical protein OROGR_016016 [Orobanche gracilis]